MEEAFSPFGQILSISIKCDEETNKNLSYGFVKYSSEISAHQAMKALNGKILCGRPLRLLKIQLLYCYIYVKKNIHVCT